MYTITETPLFQRLVNSVWTEEERSDFIDWISDNPLAADGEIVLLWVYAKAKLDNVRPEFLLKLKEQFDD